MIDFVRVGMLLWNIKTDKRCIVVELYQFLSIYDWLVRIFNSSDDAVFVWEQLYKNIDFETPPKKEELKNKLKLILYQLGFIFRNIDNAA